MELETLLFGERLKGRNLKPEGFKSPLKPLELETPHLWGGSNFIPRRDLHLIRKRKIMPFIFSQPFTFYAASPLCCFSFLTRTQTLGRLLSPAVLFRQPFPSAGHILSRWVVLFHQVAGAQLIVAFLMSPLFSISFLRLPDLSGIPPSSCRRRTAQTGQGFVLQRSVGNVQPFLQIMNYCLALHQIHRWPCPSSSLCLSSPPSTPTEALTG